MQKLQGKKSFSVGTVEPRLKVDWFAFTIDESKDQKNGNSFFLLKSLGYDLEEFDEIAGMNFFNSGFSLSGGFVKVFYNDPQKVLQKGSSRVHSYVFTGVGCSDLHLKINGDWVRLFRDLKEFGVSFRRIDLALDDLNYPSLITFDYIERKLKRKEFRSSKRSYNILEGKNTSGQTVSKTVYMGSRKTTGSFGHTLLRVYQKAYELIFAKHQEGSLPPEVLLQSTLPNFNGDYNWIRWELEITKEKAISMIDLILELSKTSSNPISEAYYSVLKDTIDFLVPTFNKKGQLYKNKNRWVTSPKYLKFLKNAKAAKLENPDKLFNLETVLQWLKYSVTPTLQLCNEIFGSAGYDFYDVLRLFEQQNISEYSKKQKRLLAETQLMSNAELTKYLKDFLEPK